MSQSQIPDTLQFRLFIDCESAAFDNQPEKEIARILRELAVRLDHGEDFGACRNLYDLRGDFAGQVSLKTGYEHDRGTVHNSKR